MSFFKPKFWDKNQVSLFSILLFPIALLIKLLNLFKRSITKTYQCSIPVICVGNIYLGGTGKTPLCIEIFSILKDLNMNPAFIRKKYDSFQDEVNLQKQIGPIYQSKKRIDSLKDAIQNLKIGDPKEIDTNVGPLSRKDILNEIHEQVNHSIEGGATLVYGGSRIDRKGFFYSPTILTGITKNMPVYYEETFGPVFTVIKFETTDKMIEIANDSEFGLGGSLWSENREEALSIARKIETGAVFINAFTRSDPRLPFGGIKKSGYGRELSEFGIREFVNIKTIAVH